MENVGKKPARKMSSKAKWIILFSVIGAMIVGLIIAIVVILVNRGNNNGASNDSSETAQQSTDEAAVQTYEEITSEIAQKIIEAAGENGEGEMDPAELASLYQEKIDATTDEKVRAMLMSDYYMVKLSQNPGIEMKDEIINGLLEVDKILETPASAMKISNVAFYYGDEELGNKYYAIAMERGNSVEENVDGTEQTGESDQTEENSNPNEEETVG